MCVGRRGGSATKQAFSNAVEILTQIHLPFSILWVHSLTCYLNFIFPEFEQGSVLEMLILSAETFIPSVKEMPLLIYFSYFFKLLCIFHILPLEMLTYFARHVYFRILCEGRLIFLFKFSFSVYSAIS